jgi:hypothetical protein
MCSGHVPCVIAALRLSHLTSDHKVGSLLQPRLRPPCGGEGRNAFGAEEEAPTSVVTRLGCMTGWLAGADKGEKGNEVGNVRIMSAIGEVLDWGLTRKTCDYEPARTRRCHCERQTNVGLCARTAMSRKLGS